MENASKALLIAGAILITLLVISLGVLIFNTFGGTAKEMANLDDQEINSFNMKIKPYLGNNVSGSQVRALIQLARSIDQNSINNSDSYRRVSIYYKDKSGTSHTLVKLTASDTVTSGDGISPVESNKFYSVRAQYSSDGFITTINITQN